MCRRDACERTLASSAAALNLAGVLQEEAHDVEELLEEMEGGGLVVGFGFMLMLMFYVYSHVYVEGNC